MNGFYCQLEALSFQHLEMQYMPFVLKCQCKFSCPTLWMCVTQCVTLELNISEAVLKQEYWIPGAKIKLYAKKFSDVSDFRYFWKSSQFPSCVWDFQVLSGGGRTGHRSVGKHISLAQRFCPLTAGDVKELFRFPGGIKSGLQQQHVIPKAG